MLISSRKGRKIKCGDIISVFIGMPCKFSSTFNEEKKKNLT